MKNNELRQRVKELRGRKGLSQEELAEQSGLSLRTVQRIEAGVSEPRGDTLKRLAEALDATPDQIVDWVAKEDRRFLAGMNFSAISFIAFPFLGIILPMVLWISKKDKVKNIDEIAKKILNFQITWMIVSILMLLGFMYRLSFTITRAGDISPVMIASTFKVLFLCGAALGLYNILLIIVNTVRINNQRKPVYIPSVRFIK